jgi:hypothetical protein
MSSAGRLALRLMITRRSLPQGAGDAMVRRVAWYSVDPGSES